MKPLDLNVSIQNSYEASRSEAVRLDKPVAASHMANEDAKRDQVHRDQSVTHVPEAHFNDDVFDREKEYEPDYKDRSGSKKNSTKSETTPKDTGNEKRENPVKESEAGKTAEPDSDGHISTYA